jgi:hypothetical protein
MSPTRLLVLALALAACGSDDSQPTDQLGGSLTVTGTVVDFETSSPLNTATVTTAGLSPTPTVTPNGAAFTLDGVLEYSAFQIVASAPSTHRSTYNSVAVTNADLTGITVAAVGDTYLANVAASFTVTPSASNGTLVIRLVDAQGNPKQGVAASNITLAGVAGASPKFLDASLAAAPGSTSSSTSGYVIFFDVPAGVVALATPANATATLDMPASPIVAGAVTLARATVTDGAPDPLPMNVSFSADVYPIFTARGCVNCHAANGPGKDLGGLTLGGGAMLVYKELVQDDPTRVVTSAPETSLVLTMPSAESPPDAHPNVTFTGPQDLDYQKILVWIREGAQNN